MYMKCIYVNNEFYVIFYFTCIYIVPGPLLISFLSFLGCPISHKIITDLKEYVVYDFN